MFFNSETPIPHFSNWSDTDTFIMILWYTNIHKTKTNSFFLNGFASPFTKTEKETLLVSFPYGLNKSICLQMNIFMAHCTFHCTPYVTHQLLSNDSWFIWLLLCWFITSAMLECNHKKYQLVSGICSLTDTNWYHLK